MFSMLFSLLAAFTYTVMISYIAFLAAKDISAYYFINTAYHPSKTENRAVATFGVLGYIAYMGNNFGALIHLNFKMWRFQCEKWTGYNRSFYRSLLIFFGVFTFVAGAAQLALGAYVYDKLEDQRLSYPVVTGPYVVTYPEVSITVGAFQVVLSFFIFCRAKKAPVEGSTSNKHQDAFQQYAWFVFLLSICGQVLTQVVFAAPKLDDGDTYLEMSPMGGFAAMLVTLVTGLGIFPIYLDAMYYTTPASVAQGCFSTVAPEAKNPAGEERKTEALPGTAAAAGDLSKSAV